MERSTKILLTALLASIAAPLILIALLYNAGVDPLDLLIQAILLLTMLPITAMGVYMWATGKGAMLIAGYNTSPREIRERYDPQALARFVGKLVAVTVTIMLVGIEGLMLADNAMFFWALLLISMAVLVLGAYYMNTSGRFLREGVSQLDVMPSPADRERNRKYLIKVLAVVVIIVAVILIAVVLLSGSGSVSASVGTDGLKVDAPFVDDLVPYDDITSVELRDHFDQGRRVGGFGGSEISSGRFQNDEFGRYTLARYNQVESCIVVHHSSGVLVFNLGSEESTLQIYDELRSKV